MTIPSYGDKIAPVADDGGKLLRARLTGDAEAERPGDGRRPSEKWQAEEKRCRKRMKKVLDKSKAL